jgi:hypothetical protein
MGCYHILETNFNYLLKSRISRFVTLYYILYNIYIYIYYILLYYIILYYSVTNRYQRWLTIAQERSDYIRSKESSMTG